jgi:ubiquitin-protein ligase
MTTILKRVVKEVAAIEALAAGGDETIIGSEYNNNLVLVVDFVMHKGSVYYREGECYSIRINMTKNFPLNPPEVNFVTNIYHPNVSVTDGTICVDFLKSNWTPILTIDKIIGMITILLDSPTLDSPLNAEAVKLFTQFAGPEKHADLHNALHGKSKGKKIGSNTAEDTKGKKSADEESPDHSDAKEQAMPVPKQKKKVPADDSSEEEAPAPKPKKKVPVPADDEEVPAPKPKKKVPVPADDSDDDDEEEPAPKPKKKAPVSDDDSGEESTPVHKSKSSKKKPVSSESDDE